MSLTSKSFEEKIEEEVRRRVRLKLRAWEKIVNSALDRLKLRWEEICDDEDVLPCEGQSRSDPAAAQLDGDNTEIDGIPGSFYLAKFDFDTLRTSSPNRTEEDGGIAEDEYPASGRISDLLNHVPLAREVEEEGNHEDEGEVEYQMRGTVENENIDNLEAEDPFVEPPSQAAKSKRKVADTPCPYCYKMFVEAKGVKIHISKSRYCNEQRMQRRSGFMGDNDGPSAESTPIKRGIHRT